MKEYKVHSLNTRGVRTVTTFPNVEQAVLFGSKEFDKADNMGAWIIYPAGTRATFTRQFGLIIC